MHRFWNAGDDELVCSGYVRPPDNIEYFLTKIFESTRANGGKRPRMFDAAYLLSRYRAEFGMAEIPAPVQRFVFPIVVAVGRMFGLGKRFADAPEPVRVRRSSIGPVPLVAPWNRKKRREREKIGHEAPGSRPPRPSHRRHLRMR